MKIFKTSMSHPPRLFSQDPLWPNHLEKSHGMKHTLISHLLKNVLSHVGVDCRKGIVQEIEILVGIHCPGSIKSSYQARQHIITWPSLSSASDLRSG